MIFPVAFGISLIAEPEALNETHHVPILDIHFHDR
jgi:hypothetical protein